MSRSVTLDANEAVAEVAYRLSEVIAIYPITPSSLMGELADDWASHGRTNRWGAVPTVIEMQSEGGAAGCIHGALQGGALSTTFTASQGLLLMIPNMFKIAGELTPAVFHVAARTIATHALSIFGDHSDVMGVRHTGWALLCSGSVQEAMDFALIAHAATLRCRLPFLHFFDGFRTSHELMKVTALPSECFEKLIPDDLIADHRRRALTPDAPVIRGTAQNPDVFFQSREASNALYSAAPAVVQSVMDEFGRLTGRHYHLFDYEGAEKADRVVIVMGSGAETVAATVAALREEKPDSRIGVLKVRLYRPFDLRALIAALPASVSRIAVLDRTKEPGSIGEPLFQDVVTAFAEWCAESPGRSMPTIIGGRYGLSSKEFTPAMVRAIFEELDEREPKRRFTVGIQDDVTHLSLSYDPHYTIESAKTYRAVFVGLGSDGTISANKNTIKIIAENTPLHAQGFFVYDSKKSGSITTSHLRFGPDKIQAPYLISEGDFVGCHQFNFVDKVDLLKYAAKGAVMLINTPYPPSEIWDQLPREVQEGIIEKGISLHVIDAYRVAQEAGLGRRISTIMQVCFFALSNVMPAEEAISQIKGAITKTFGKRGDEVVQRNFAAVDAALTHLYPVEIPRIVSATHARVLSVPKEAPAFVKKVTGEIIAGRGDLLPVSAFPVDGTYPTGTAQWERRAISEVIPVWDPGTCIQCNKCVMVCPHAVIRAKVYQPEALPRSLSDSKPVSLKERGAIGKDFPAGSIYTLQIAPDDCTGCELCVEVCPAKNKADLSKKALVMEPVRPIVEEAREHWEYFKQLPAPDRRSLKVDNLKESQLLEPLFEFSGACSGCGETPYIKAVTQLFGDRMIVANATGCSSIYGGNLPTTPWTTNRDGRGPAWANSLFEDNAEFGLGIRLAVSYREAMARHLLRELAPQVGEELVDPLLSCGQHDESEIYEQRERVAVLKEKLMSVLAAAPENASAQALLDASDYLVRKSVWIIGGDGWGYDIGYGGVDHILASGKNVNILLLDTEVYSNTGGQMSKSTPIGAVAKFAAGGKATPKKDLGLIAMNYGTVYIAQIAFGANDTQAIRALLEAERYEGPSLVIAYSHCIAHGYLMKHGLTQQKRAVESAHWPLYRFDPRREAEGLNPLILDSKDPKIPVQEYMSYETRYKILEKMDPERAAALQHYAQQVTTKRWAEYKRRAGTASSQS